MSAPFIHSLIVDEWEATPEGTLSYTYDAAGNLQSMISNHTHGVSVTYSYDARVSVGGSLSTGWDDLNRPSTVADGTLPAH